MDGSRRRSVNLEEDDNEPKKTLEQKEVISAQMIGVVQSRLKSLRTVAENRMYGLECDLKANVDHSSRELSGIPDPYETSKVVTNGRLRTGTLSTSARNQLLMERLFGSDEKARMRNKTMKKSKADILKTETRRNKRAQLEKQLQVSIERHVTRTVDSVLTSMDNISNIELNAKLLISHTIEKMRIIQGKKTFKRFALNDLSCTQFELIFWLVFSRIFQRNSHDEQSRLMESICSQYVKMLSALRLNKDLIFRIYPYAIAGSVCSGFHYLFPGSRHLYTNDFKHEVFVIVCELLLGLKLCPISVQMTRRQYFPEDLLEDISAKIKFTESEQSTLPTSTLTKSFSEITLGNTRKTMRVHQVRTSFNAAQLSPLMKEYLVTSKDGIKKSCFLRRTTPVPRCLVGGEDTYKKTNVKKDQIHSIAQQASELYDEYRRDVIKYQKDAQHAIKLIDETKDIVLNGGKAAIRAYKSILHSHSMIEDKMHLVPQ
ncbi:hypothetical protein Ae201684P_020922 [Aphanomyces euteiches]|uniref:Uncharacterized protein n=1 Tax=Aphanomyces euteiches TaxID=100861 RepID=A0A6G0WWX7_9STRA|nr:hypothetical protein Ae201684_010938 [Aphanomyces euteiches]KAH9061587.1 hypothetical protein Ae201684P_020922 [Aphanomyces euteiches]KAH9157482.1 hypothetical protein AeRB84_000681 [Aphanomyces euteiches]